MAVSTSAGWKEGILETMLDQELSAKEKMGQAETISGSKQLENLL